MKQRNRALVLLAVLSMGAFGCELVADFDRSKIDGGPLPEEDSGPVIDGAPGDVANDTTVPHPDGGQDVNQPDVNGQDTSTEDTGTNDTGSNDTGTADTGGDTSVADTGTDTGAVDAAKDTGVDTGVDAGIDTGVDAGVDAEVDTGVVDTGIDVDVDAGVDAEVDAGIDASDAAVTSCTQLDPSGVNPVTVADSAATPPTLNGGTIPTSGTFVLTNDTFYFSDGGSSGQAGIARKQIIEFTATGLDGAESDNAAAPDGFAEAITPAANANQFTATFTCGVTGVTTVTYDVSGTAPNRVVIATPDGIDYRTYTEQP